MTKELSVGGTTISVTCSPSSKVSISSTSSAKAGYGNARKNTINILSIIFITCISVNLFAKEINIYSHRQPFLINPFLELFTNETGIKTNVIYSKKGLAQRLQSEGENSPADVILTVDIGRLYIYSDLNLLASIESKILIENVPSHLRSPENNWFALSKRARVIAVNKEKIKDGEITRLEDLANPKWKGQICSRPGSHVYNRGIMASVLAEYGEENAEAWAKGLVNNFARRPQGNDRAQVKSIYEGECNIAIINNYYYGKLKSSEDPEQRKWAKKVKLVFQIKERMIVERILTYRVEVLPYTQKIKKKQ